MPSKIHRTSVASSNNHLFLWCLHLLFRHYIVSDSLWPHGLQHARLPCPSLSPRVCPSSWCLHSYLLILAGLAVVWAVVCGGSRLALAKWLCCRKGYPFKGPKLGSCWTLRNESSEETHVLTKQEILLGKGTQVESRNVREPRRTAVSHGLQSRVLWWWD